MKKTIQFLKNTTNKFLLKSLALGFAICMTASLSAQTNVALGKTAYQSSIGHGGAAGRAVDGNTSGNWGHGSTTHTAKEANPWWEVDLGAEYDITKIVIYNRTDCCSERLSKFDILVKKTSSERGSYFYGNKSNSGSRMYKFRDNKKGRYVRIKLLANEYLSLAEVQVYGTRVGGSISNSGSVPADAGRYKVTVTADWMKCIQSGDGNGDATEYFGEIAIGRDNNLASVVFKRTDANTLDLAGGQAKVINKSINYEISTNGRSFSSVSNKIALSSWFKDYDSTSGNDNCGSASKTVYLKDLGPGTHNLYLNMAAEGDKSQIKFIVNIRKI